MVRNNIYALAVVILWFTVSTCTQTKNDVFQENPDISIDSIAVSEMINVREIGLMTMTAHKQEGEWKWVAVTNQHTPWFYPEIEPVVIE